MLTREEVVNQLSEHKVKLQHKVHLKTVALFGSYARAEQTPSSDIDVLVEFSQPVGFEFIDLLEYFENIFKRKIDLVSKAGVKPHYLPFIEEDAIYV
jgi:uncharacterized protein